MYTLYTYYVYTKSTKYTQYTPYIHTINAVNPHYIHNINALIPNSIHTVSIVTNSCTYLLKNTLKSYKFLSPRHVSDHTRIHPQGAITRSWLKYLQVHGASPYSLYCGCIGELQCENMRPFRQQSSPTCH